MCCLVGRSADCTPSTDTKPPARRETVHPLELMLFISAVVAAAAAGCAKVTAQHTYAAVFNQWRRYTRARQVK